MKHAKVFVTAFLLFLSASTVGEVEVWPYPEDVPVSAPVDVGLAGETPVDISRFLLAQGDSSVSINAAGTHIAFVSSITGRRQLWVQPVDGNQAKQLTFGNGISFYRWHPDGEQLLYGADNDGNEREAFYLISRDGNKEQLILGHSQAYRSFGAFSEDGSRFTYASTERNGRDFDIYLHDLSDNKSKMVFQAEFGFFPDAWRPNTNQIIVTETRGEDASDVYLLDLDSLELTTLFKPDIAAEFVNFAWQPDGKAVYFSSNLDREMMTVMRYDMASAKTEVIQESANDLTEVTLCHQGELLVWTENNLGFDSLWTMNLKTQKIQHLEPGLGVFSISCAADTDDITLRIAGPQTPATVLLLNAEDGTAETLREPSMAGIDATKLIIPEAISFPAQDGITLHGLLYLPAGTPENVPVVVKVHGGPTAQARPGWQPLAQYLVGKGIAVLDINVRGSTGYGKTYMRLDNQKLRLDSVRDLTDALTYLEDDKRVNASKAAVMGGSYGGYMVNAVMGLYPDAFAAGASFVGVSDWVRALKTASPGLKASDRIEYGDIRESQWQEFYANNSPINTVHKIKAPMFYEHGVNDPRDPVTESDSMVKVLRNKGIDVTYLRFPDEGHSVSKLENRITFYRQLAIFLERHLDK